MRNLIKALTAKQSYKTPQAYISEQHGLRHLHLGSNAIQSSMRLSDPFDLVLAYSRCMFSFLLFEAAPPFILHIGLGGGSIAKFAYQHLPTTRQIIIELSPQIIDIAHSQFYVPDDKQRLRIIQAEGQDYLKSLKEAMPIVLLDAFGPEGIVGSLATTSFFRLCHTRLNEQGILISNLWRSDRAFPSIVNRLSQVFNRQVLCLPAIPRGNVIAIAFKHWQPLSWETLQHRAQQLEQRIPLEFTSFITNLKNTPQQTIEDSNGLISFSR